MTKRPAPHPRRDQTDKSLQVERESAEDRFASHDARERPEADEVRAGARRFRWHPLSELLKSERSDTDRDLRGERNDADQLSIDLAGANARMVQATILAHEQRDAADAAKARAEDQERELRSVAETREMFIAILGHDLRNPLASIKGAAGTMLRRGSLDERDAKSVTHIVRAVQRMTEMITQLLDVTRVRLGGGLPIAPRAADLGEICREVADDFERAVEVELEGDLLGFWDSGRVGEALSNVIGNAVQYAEQGTKVQVTARPDGPDVEVRVINRGPPIPQEILAVIFEPFRRAQQRTSGEGGNLGLGLYIAKQIVGAHGGTIAARSADGITTFTLRLPRQMPPA